MSEHRDRVRELAEKLFEGDVVAVYWAEGHIREKLRELLDAAEQATNYNGEQYRYELAEVLKRHRAQARREGMLELQAIEEAFKKQGKAWEIDPMGDAYREADNELDDAIAAAIRRATEEPKPNIIIRCKICHSQSECEHSKASV